MAAAPAVTTHTTHNDDEDRRCRSCSSAALRVDWPAGDRVCTDCGLVDAERLMDQRPEWREFEDEAPTAPVRCGLVPNNEQKWVGGLQPTTLSKYVYGEPSARSSQMRKTLVKCHQIIERNMEKRHSRMVKDAHLDRLIRKRKRREELESNGHTGPHLDRLIALEEEEDTTLAQRAALYAQKWSLTRCLLLCGTPEQQSAAKCEEDTGTLEELKQSMDSVLLNAARELYRGYTILMTTGQTLQLPDHVLNEASQFLAAYAVAKDGLTVRGVASQLKRNQSKQTSVEAHQQAQSALREYNTVRQCSALTVALLFYTARRKGHFRPLADVCRSIPSNVIHSQIHLDWTRGEPLLKMKHCSRAMAEIKQHFPELAKSPAVPPEMVQRGTQQAQSDTLTSMDTLSLQNYIVHATRSLQLPPVAAACLQILVKSAADNSERLPVQTASLTYFLAMVGQTMQKLAMQSSPRKRPRHSQSLRPPTTQELARIGKEAETETTKASSEADEILETMAAEEKAYQMQRMWNAWKDQTPWWRSLPEISKAVQVPAHQIRTHYQHKIYPHRHALLQCLAEAETENAPLSSVLLPQISLAAPLMKDI